jgi:pyrimidine operon attenuation protein/uracil phosphoribosyltransferase
MTDKAVILDEQAISRAITRISHEIIERNKGVGNIVLLGIQRRGVPLARRIAEKIYEVENVKVSVGVIDITFYRDDLSLLSAHPVINGTYIDFIIKDRVVILVDDVIFTGRTTRAAIDVVFDIDRPMAVQLAVLIDRGHRELPFRPDYVGKNVPTSSTEMVNVKLDEIDGENIVTIVDK